MRALSLVLALLLGAVVGWFAHDAYATGQVPGTTSQPVPGAPAGATHPGSDGSVVEGVDYSLSTNNAGKAARWSCTEPIAVALAGIAPRGAERLLEDAVAVVARESRLPLRVGTDKGTVDDGPRTITVRYVDRLKTERQDAVGLGGFSSSDDGNILHGNVWLLKTDHTNDPADPLAGTVLLHELMHAVGVGHAAENTPEIMAPTTTSNTPTALGSGDLHALAAIGCTPTAP